MQNTYIGEFTQRDFETEVHNSFVTAIATVYTPDGFVIGADGLAIDSVSGEASKNVRKILTLENGSTRLAYAWTGTTQTFDRNGKCHYDLDTLSMAVVPLAVRSVDFPAFLTFVCASLQKGLPQIENCPKTELARVRFVGYFQGIPCSGNIVIAHSSGLLTPRSDQVSVPASYHKRVFSGAQSVFSKYSNWVPDSESQAIDFVRSYIQECIDSSEPDCAAIGGHLHIAKITPSCLSWVLPPVSVKIKH